MDMGGIGPPGPRLLFGGGPLRPGPYEPGPIGAIEGPLGGFIRGFIGFMPGGPVGRISSNYNCLSMDFITDRERMISTDDTSMLAPVIIYYCMMMIIICIMYK